MTTQILFELGQEVVIVIIKGNDIQFGSTSQGAQLATIDGLQLNYAGVIKQFPDLKGKTHWREIAVQRFKEKMREYPSERAKVDYVIDEFKKMGYKPKKLQVNGSRPFKL